MIQHQPRKFNGEGIDRISGLPDSLIEKILSCVPLCDAVRTSVLSKKWRYRWTTIPKLVLDLGFCDHVCRKTLPIEYVNIVNSLLSQHNGPLEEVHLINPYLCSPQKIYINHFIWIVLMRGVKKLTLFNWYSKSHYLPPSFPYGNLTQLELKKCVFKPKPLFRGFPNLLSLKFYNVRCDPETFSRLTANCPKLKRVFLDSLSYKGRVLSIHAPNLEFLYVRGRFNSIHLQGGQRVTEMELHLERTNEYPTWDNACLIEFFGSLVSLKFLKLGHIFHKLFIAASLLKKLPSPLNKLKILKLGGLDFNDLAMLRWILCLVSSSPNLCKLEILCYPTYRDEPQRGIYIEEAGYEHCSLDRLEKIHLGPVVGTEAEMELIKFLFRHSGALQLFDVWHEKRRNSPSLSEISKVFKKIPRVSRRVKVRHSYGYTDICSEVCPWRSSLPWLID